MKKQEGASLGELLVALAILSILMLLAMPAFGSWRESAQYRASARELASAMRESRNRAITTNLQHRVEIDLSNARYRLTHGNRAANSTASSWANNVVRDWYDLPSSVSLRANVDCSVEQGTINMHFNPTGSSNSRYICVIDRGNEPRLQVGVGFAATGRVVIRRDW